MSSGRTGFRDHPSSSRRPGWSWPHSAIAVVQVAVGVVLVAYLLGLALHGPGYDALVDGYLSALTAVLPAAACWVAWLAASSRRREVAWLALAVTAWAVGDV